MASASRSAAASSSRAVRLARRSAWTASSSATISWRTAAICGPSASTRRRASPSASRSASDSSSTSMSPVRTTLPTARLTDTTRPSMRASTGCAAAVASSRASVLVSYSGTRASRNQLTQPMSSRTPTAAVRQPRERSDSSARSERENGLDMRHLYNPAFSFQLSAFGFCSQCGIRPPPATAERAGLRVGYASLRCKACSSP